MEWLINQNEMTEIWEKKETPCLDISENSIVSTACLKEYILNEIERLCEIQEENDMKMKVKDEIEMMAYELILFGSRILHIFSDGECNALCHRIHTAYMKKYPSDYF